MKKKKRERGMEVRGEGNGEENMTNRVRRKSGKQKKVMESNKKRREKRR